MKCVHKCRTLYGLFLDEMLPITDKLDHQLEVQRGCFTFMQHFQVGNCFTFRPFLAGFAVLPTIVVNSCYLFGTTAKNYNNHSLEKREIHYQAKFSSNQFYCKVA